MSLEGSLHDMPLADLFEVFRIGRKSGILQLFTSNQSASLYVTLGRVIDAIVVLWPQQQVIAQGDDAIAQIFRWEQADFAFTPDRSVVYHPVTIFHNIEQIIQFGLALACTHSNARRACLQSLEYGAAYSAQSSWLDLVPCSIEEQTAGAQQVRTTPVAAIVPVALPVTQPAPVQPKPVAPMPARHTAPMPNRRLMQAVLRRVRSL